VVALRALWFWASDPTVSRAIEALAADTPAALKAVSGHERGQPRIALVSRVNCR
jgi:hypothetical protein